MKSIDTMKLDFVKRVVNESHDLHATIAEIALDSNEIDQLLEILHEQYQTNPQLFIKMIGEEVYLDYLELINT